MPWRLSPAAMLLAPLLFALVLANGCSRPERSSPGEEDDTKAPEASAKVEAEAPAIKPLEPFDAPSLEELDAKVKWVDKPVLDAMEVLREELSKQKPLATIEEALKLRNTSDENNEKILSAIARLPESDSDVNYESTVARHIGADLRNLNPILIDSAVEMDVAGLTSFGLFIFDRHFTPFADAGSVKSWQTSDDGLYDKVVMRDDLVWSDGTPITAHDIEFSFQTILDPQVPALAVRSGTDEIRWVKAYDDHTLVYFHKQPLATNVWNLNFPIIPKHFYEPLLKDDPTLTGPATHGAIDRNPLSGGPYKIVKRVRNQEIVLERREDYYMHKGKQVRPKPFVKRVRFVILKDPNTSLLALKDENIHEMMLQPEQWQFQTVNDEYYARNTKARDVEWTYFYFGWNMREPFFSDQRVREAMSYAFNHQEMLDTLLYGLYQPSVGIFHPEAWMSADPPPKPYKQDLDKAEELLDAAGWVDNDGDGIRDKMVDGRRLRFEFTILCGESNPLALNICNLLKSNLGQIGVICNVKPTDFTVMQERMTSHKFEAYLGGWGTGADPDTARNLWMTGEGRNHVGYSNPEVDRLFLEGQREFDREKRAKIYGKIHEIIYRDQPYTWLYVRSSLWGINRNIRGFNFSPRDPFGYSPGFMSIWMPAAN